MRRGTLLTWVAYALGGVYSALFLFSAALRLVYPYEVEWNEGAVLDHSIRILHDLPIYTAPSLDFAAFVYTPFYYYLTAIAMTIGGIGLWAGRFISLLATIATALVIGLVVRRELGSRPKEGLLLPMCGAMLYLAFYHVTGFFYDIVRMDPLAVFLVVASIYAALYAKRGFILSAILLAFAYFTKQQMIFAWPALVLYFMMISKRKAAWFAACSLALLLAGTFLMNAATSGWYRFYTLTIPSVKAATGFSWRDALAFFPTTLFGSLGFFILVILLASIISGLSRRNGGTSLIVWCALLAMLSASIGIGNPGGYANVLIPLAAMIAMLFPISIAWLEERFSSGQRFAPTLLVLAFLSLAFNPLGEIMLFASSRQRQAGNEFVAVLRKMPGDVWIPFHGYIGTMAGKATHVHFMAMNDALVPHDARSARFQREIDSSLDAHRFSAIILDEDRVYGWDSIQHYTKAGKIFQLPNVFLSRIGSAPTRPQFVYQQTE